jgi:hypothetical protein
MIPITREPIATLTNSPSTGTLSAMIGRRKQPKSSKLPPRKVTAKEAYAQMIASAGNLGAKGSVLPAFAHGRKTPGAS